MLLLVFFDYKYTPRIKCKCSIFGNCVARQQFCTGHIGTASGQPYCNCNCQGLLMGKDEVRSGNCYQAGLQHGFSFADFLSEHRSVSSRHRSCWLQGRFHFPKNRGIIRPSSNFQWHCESSASASTSHC